MQIGEVYRVQLDSAAWIEKQIPQGRKTTKGKVVYCHPKKRFAVLEFEGVHGKFRECFTREQLEGKQVK